MGLHRFGLKTDIDFAHFGLNSGKVSGGTSGVYKRVCLFSSELRVKCEFEMD